MLYKDAGFFVVHDRCRPASAHSYLVSIMLRKKGVPL